MSERRWKVGLLGAGFIMEAHAKALKAIPNVDIVAVCDRSLERAQAAASRFGIQGVYANLDEMLAEPLDVVHVLLPPDLHVAATRQILEAGRSAFLEKPMGISATECRELVNLAGAKQATLGVNHNFLFLPSYERLRQDAADGTLGSLDQITINWLSPLGLVHSGPFNNWMLRHPRNLFFEIGPHLVAFMIDLVGPLDRVETDCFRPVNLPGGGRVYRRWHVHGVKGSTAVDLNLSVTLGATDHRVEVRGHAANAACDFERDLYFRDEPSGYGMPFDSIVTSLSIAGQVGANALRNLVRSMSAMLAKAPGDTPFAVSISRSVRAFYGTLEGRPDSRCDGQFGVNVIAACEAMTQQVAGEAAPSTPGPWTTLPPLKPPTILVFGGTGFIGRYLIKALVQRGFGVRAVTRSLGSAQIALAGLPVELVQGDLADPAFVDSTLAGIDVVYDLAKAVGKKWDDYYRQDVLVTKNLAERALLKGVKRFIYTGTIASYYSANAADVITSDTPLDPRIQSRDNYARAKAASEGVLMDLHRQRGFPVVIFRPGIVIGKGCSPAHPGVAMFRSDARIKFWGDGLNRLPLVLVEDVADALVLAIDKPGVEGQAFLLTDEPLLNSREYVDAFSRVCRIRPKVEPTPIWKYFLGDFVKEVVKNAIRHPNRRIPSYRDWDSKSNRARFDSRKAREVLGWKPAGTREAIIERGIVEPTLDIMR